MKCHQHPDTIARMKEGFAAHPYPNPFRFNLLVRTPETTRVPEKVRMPETEKAPEKMEMGLTTVGLDFLGGAISVD
jgi:hypothetical protein